MFEMTLCYNKLWKLLIDKKMSQTDFRRSVDISYSTLTKLRRDEVVTLEILMKICAYLDCNVGDVLDFVKVEKTEPDIKPNPNKRVRKK
jgi:DNA-binding Xre family transcriptional regulator